MNFKTPVLELQGITKAYIKTTLLKQVKNDVLKGVNLTIKQGESVALMGPSGCGKTTLLKIILGIEKQDKGKVMILGQNTLEMNKITRKNVLSKIGVIFQDPYNSLDPRKKVKDILSEPFSIHRKHFTKQTLEQALREVSLSEQDLEKYPHQFSGGQRQRINIVRALILKPRLIIADEPTSALDVSVQAQIINLLTGMQKKYHFALLFVSHSIALCKYLCQNIVSVQNGMLNKISGDEL